MKSNNDNFQLKTPPAKGADIPAPVKKRKKSNDKGNRAFTTEAALYGNYKYQEPKEHYGNHFGRDAQPYEKIALQTPFTPNTNKKFSEKLRQRFEKLGIDTKNCELIFLSETDITTPSRKTPMFKQFDNYVFSFYSSRDDEKKMAIIDYSKFQPEFLKGLSHYEEEYKYQEYIFDYGDVKEVKKKKKENGGKRGKNQKQVTNISARTLALAYGLDPDEGEGFELSHLVAHAMQGDESQDIDNLCLATKVCNTMMLYLEMAIIRRASQRKTPFSVKVIADLVELPLGENGVNMNTHLAKNILYTVSYEDISITIKFDPLSHYRPTGCVEQCFDALFNLLEEDKRALKQLDEAMKTKYVPTSPTKRRRVNKEENLIRTDKLKKNLFGNNSSEKGVNNNCSNANENAVSQATDNYLSLFKKNSSSFWSSADQEMPTLENIAEIKLI